MTQPVRNIMMIAGLLMLTLTLALTASRPARASDAARSPQAAKALDKLAFLLGDWVITGEYATPDGSRVQSHATMSSRYTMGGFAIEAQSNHPSPNGADDNVFASVHIFMVHPKSGKVAAVAINTLGNRKFNDGEFIGDDFVVVATGEMFGGDDHIERTRYSNISANRFETKMEISDDGGESWRDGQYTATYVRAR